MKPLSVIAAMAILCCTVLYCADQHVQDARHPNHVPHAAGTMLAVTFAHADHIEQACIDCHHNFVDDTGMGMCFDCHKSHADVSAQIEEHFHSLCRGCHIEHALAGEEHGSTRACLACHQPDSAP